MKLSAEQAQHAYDYLQEKGLEAVAPTSSNDVSAEVIERALNRIACTPDPRPGRVAYAMGLLHDRLPSSHDVAERMLWRMYADSLR